MRQLLYDLRPDELATWLANQGQERFRAQQVLDWACQKNAAGFEAMTNLSKELRELLGGCFEIGPLPLAACSEGPDTTKLLLDMPRGGQVECVRIRMGNTYTACLSTQVGCAVGCAFCATGQMACERNLTVGEIVGQLVTLRACGSALQSATSRGTGVSSSLNVVEGPVTHLDRRDACPTQLPVSNVVFMGMGEPFHNYENTVGAVRLMTDKRAFGMSPSRITVSTAGVVPLIRKYTQERLPSELTISLNAPNDELRKRLMPGVAKWPISEVAAACKQYSEATGGQPVTFAYVLIDGVNDLLDHARELAQLLRRQPHHLNVIPLNPVSHTDLRAPNKARTSAFVHHCRKFGLNVSLRKSKGSEIGAACGQLRTRAKAHARTITRTE